MYSIYKPTVIDLGIMNNAVYLITVQDNVRQQVFLKSFNKKATIIHLTILYALIYK